MHFFAVINSDYREFEDLTPLSRYHCLHTIDTGLFKPFMTEADIGLRHERVKSENEIHH